MEEKEDVEKCESQVREAEASEVSRESMQGGGERDIYC